jgi:hypothetical protein
MASGATAAKGAGVDLLADFSAGLGRDRNTRCNQTSGQKQGLQRFQIHHDFFPSLLEVQSTLCLTDPCPEQMSRSTRGIISDSISAHKGNSSGKSPDNPSGFLITGRASMSRSDTWQFQAISCRAPCSRRNDNREC